MKIERFGPLKTGILVPIETLHGDDHAFIPNRLPAAWEKTDDTWRLLVKARDRVSMLNGIGQTLPHPRLLFQPLQRREAVHSNNLEGTYATPSELMLFELDRRNQKSDGGTASDPRDNPAAWEEVYNYYNAMRHGHNWVSKKRPLNAELVRTIHKVLMRGVRGFKNDSGEFRQEQVFVDHGRYVPPPHTELGECLDDLFGHLAHEDSETDPLIRAYITHYQFEAIHPFKDGNGRVGRVLLSLCVSAWLGHHRPWLYLSEFFDNNRREYLRRLFAISTEAAWVEWITFCLEGTIEQADSAIRRCEALLSLKKEYHAKTKNERERAHTIIEKLFDNPMIRVSDIEKLCKVTYPTAKKDLEFLVEKEILREADDIYPRTFFAPQLFSIAYGD